MSNVAILEVKDNQLFKLLKQIDDIEKRMLDTKKIIKERTKKSRPQLDEQELEELSYKLQLAFESKASVTIQLW